MQLGQKLIPLGIDFDSSPLYIKSDKAFFLKGIEQGWLINNAAGQNGYEFKPAESNTLYCSLQTMPPGVSTVIGYYYFAEASEGYIVAHNSLGNHFIYRLRGIDGTCEKVYDFCPTFKGITDKPKYFFSRGRIAVKSLCRYLPDGTKQLYKELLLVNKQAENIRIVVEDSIATNSFSTPFFTPTDNCCGDRCRLIRTGVPTPMGQIKITPIPATAADKKTQNTVSSQMFQFRFMDENAWGQVSEYGLISDQFFNNLASCSKDVTNQPHCVWLQTKRPCPEIVKRTLAFRTCVLNKVAGTDGNAFSEWKDAFTINLYDQTNPLLKWYERSYDSSGKDFELVNGGKDIRIKFCNNRECKPIPIENIRSENPAPIRSGSVASISKSLLYADNENGIDKIPLADLKSIDFALEPTVACDVKYYNIKVYAVVHNFEAKQNEPIYSRNNKSVFGGFGEEGGIFNDGLHYEENVDSPESGISASGGNGQYFPEAIHGFRARLAGTNYTAESVQYEVLPSGLSKIGVIQDRDTAQNYLIDVIHHRRGWAIQEFDFGLVPAGLYYFEINGHNDTENLDKTSTYYIHTTSVNGYAQGWGVPVNHQKRILIDNTAGPYDGMATPSVNNLAVIADLTFPQTGSSWGSRVIRGYVYEDKDNKIPIEKAEVRTDAGHNDFGSPYSDHNGFYFTSRDRPFLGHVGQYRAQLYSIYKCQPWYIGQTGIKRGEGTTLADNLYATDTIQDYATSLCSRWNVKGNISECGTGSGIAGLAVIIAGTREVFTNNQGDFNIVAHYANGRLPEMMIVSVGSCFVLDCNCKAINIKTSVSQPTCPSCYESVVQMGSFSLQTIVGKGAPHGSRIQIGVQGHEWLGRSTDIATDPSLIIDFPSEVEQGNATYPRVKIKLPATFSPAICGTYQRLTFYWSKNTNYEDFFEWAADEVQFIDAAENKTTQNPRFVKIWYRSLNEFNATRGFNTNLAWSFMDDKGNTRLGDIIEFIQNEDGKYLPPNTVGRVQYDKEGTYILVDYDDSLKDLKDGVRFKVKRPYACETKKTFYEFGFPINFCAGDCRPRDDDGNIVTEFYLDLFSAYRIPRQIPVTKDVTEGDKTIPKKNDEAIPFCF